MPIKLFIIPCLIAFLTGCHSGQPSPQNLSAAENAKGSWGRGASGTDGSPYDRYTVTIHELDDDHIRVTRYLSEGRTRIQKCKLPTEAFFETREFFAVFDDSGKRLKCDDWGVVYASSIDPEEHVYYGENDPLILDIPKSLFFKTYPIQAGSCYRIHGAWHDHVFKGGGTRICF